MSKTDSPLLMGQRVLVTRPAHQVESLKNGLRKLGAEIILFPTIEIKPLEKNGLLDEAIYHIDRYHWLVFTSVNSVQVLVQRLQALNLIPKAHLAHVHVAAVGTTTAMALKKHGVNPNLLPDNYTAQGLLNVFGQLDNVNQQRVLLPQADRARPLLANGMRAFGAAVDAITAYHTQPRQHGPTPPPTEFITFTSPSTVIGYVNCLAGGSFSEATRDCQIICIGPVTAETVTTLGGQVAAVADPYTVAGMLKAITATCARER